MKIKNNSSFVKFDFNREFKIKCLSFVFLGVIWSLSNIGYVRYFGSLFSWFTLFPFIFLLNNESIKRGIILSTVFGFSAYLVHFWWMIIPVTIVMKNSILPPHIMVLSFLLGLVITVGVSFFHGFIYTLMFVLSKIISKRRFFFFVIFPLVATVVDGFFPKLWMDYLGYSQFCFPYITQAVDLLGVNFLTFLMMLTNSLIAFAFCCLKEKRYYLQLICYSCFTIVIISITLIYGVYRYNNMALQILKAPTVNIGLVQGNFSGLEKKRETINSQITRYNVLSKKLLKENPKLIVWPESAIPVKFSSKNANYDRIKYFNNVPLLFGGHYVIKKDESDYLTDNDKLFNSLILVNKNMMFDDVYNKTKLLPFTEEMPGTIFDFVFKIMNLREFDKGDGPKIMKVDNIRFSPSVCYEDIIPDFMRKSIRVGKDSSNLFINSTNDSWFGETIEPYMHLMISSFRSIENRKSLVRVTCTGYSAIVDPLGRITYLSSLSKQESVVKTVSLLEGDTIFNRGGFLFVHFLLVIFVFIVLYVFVKNAIYVHKTMKNEIKVRYNVNIKQMWMD